MMEILEKGVLRKKEGNSFEMVDYYMTYLDTSYIEEIIALKDFVIGKLEDPQLFASASREILMEEVLKPGRGLVIGIFAQGQLIAYRSLKFPGKISNNIGRELGIPEEELEKVIYLQATVVHPDYRGNRIQLKTLGYIFDLAKERDLWHMATTISPYNYPSLKNSMTYKLTIRDLKSRGGGYGGNIRFLLYRDLRKEEKEEAYEETLSIDHRDIDGQAQLLEKGYVGFALNKNNEGYEIYYGKV